VAAGEAFAHVEHGADDAEGEDGDEDEGAAEGAGGDEDGEEAELLGEFAAVVAVDFAEAFGDVAGVFADGEEVEVEVGEDVVVFEGVGEGGAVVDEHAGGGEAVLDDGVLDGALGHAEGFGGVDAAFEEGGAEVGDAADVGVDEDILEKGKAEGPDVGGGAALGGGAPLDDGDDGDEGEDEEPGAVGDGALLHADEDGGGEGHVAAHVVHHFADVGEEDVEEE